MHNGFEARGFSAERRRVDQSPCTSVCFSKLLCILVVDNISVCCRGSKLEHEVVSGFSIRERGCCVIFSGYDERWGNMEVGSEEL